MKKPLNNKGYMLVEIVLAFALTMVVAYFVTDLTIKLKNKNDDLMVRTLVSADQAIIYNTIMKDLYRIGSGNFKCSDIQISGKKFTYKDFTNVISDYADFGTYSCANNSSGINIVIPMSVKQLPDEKFDIVIKFRVPV